jgi:hypothetical protein
MQSDHGHVPANRPGRASAAWRGESRAQPRVCEDAARPRKLAILRTSSMSVD